MNTKLRAYSWIPYTDADCGIVVVAYNAKQAKQMGRFAGIDYDEYIDIRVKRIRKADVSGITKPKVIQSGKEGLRRKLYGWVDEDCDFCGRYAQISEIKEDKFICNECYEKLEEAKNERNKKSD